MKICVSHEILIFVRTLRKQVFNYFEKHGFKRKDDK
jgi:hypothetical protein